MHKIKLRIEDREYTAFIPLDYTDIGRLTWVGGYPGVNAYNPKGKVRFFRAKQVKQGRPL